MTEGPEEKNKQRKYVPVSRSVIYSLIMTFVATIIVSGVSIQYANYVDRTSRQLWCGFVTTIDNASKQQPPSGATGKAIAEEVKKLRHELGCDQ